MAKEIEIRCEKCNDTIVTKSRNRKFCDTCKLFLQGMRNRARKERDPVKYRETQRKNNIKQAARARAARSTHKPCKACEKPILRRAGNYKYCDDCKKVNYHKRMIKPTFVRQVRKTAFTCSDIQRANPHRAAKIINDILAGQAGMG